MPQGKHLPGYQRPRKGEKRKRVQPTAIEKLPGELRDKVRRFVEAARDGYCRCEKQTSHRHSWDGLASVANRLFGLKLTAMQYHRDFDVFVQQVRQESEERAVHVKEMAAMFERIGIKNLPQATLNAFAGESYAALKSADAGERRAALGNLLLVQAKLISAQAAQQRVDIEQQKVDLAKKKFEQVAAKVAGLKDAVSGASKTKPTREELVKKLDEIYDLTQPK